MSRRYRASRLTLPILSLPLMLFARSVAAEGGGSASTELSGKTVAILATDGFEQSELLEPKRALEAAGAKTIVFSNKVGKIRGWNHDRWGVEVPVDRDLDQADANELDALVLPGGVMNPDRLRMDERAVAFVKEFAKASKPVAAICHGPWLLVEAEMVRGREITSWPSLKTDVVNAGGKWVDREVVRDGSLITSRKPDDIPAFSKELIRAVATVRPG